MLRTLITFNLVILIILSICTATNAKDKNTASIPSDKSVHFIENKGQITDQHGNSRKDIDGKLEANGVTMFVGNGQIHYQWIKTEQKGNTEEALEGEYNTKFLPDTSEQQIDIYRLDVTLTGANKHVQPTFEQATGYYENHYTAATGIGGAVVKAYHKITYKEIYPGIDWVLYVKNNTIKYDFIVHPGGNPADIQLKYEGSTQLQLTDGVLQVTTPFGSITEAAPYSYDAATRQEIHSAYTLKGNTLSFDIANTGKTIVIDPTLVWGTYYGGGIHDVGVSVGVDDNENVYFTGDTRSVTHIATTGAHQVTIGSTATHDCYLTKFNKNGVRDWGTYFGGADWDGVASIYVTPGGSVFIGGFAGSTNLATTGAHQTQKGHGFDGLIANFNNAGQLLWSTYYGGNQQDNIFSITGDQNFIYIGGGTWSDTGISTPGSHKPISLPSTITSSDEDGFIAKFTHNGTRIWGTYYGGDHLDEIQGIALDPSGNIVVTGYTRSDTGIASPGAYDKTRNTGQAGSNQDAFIAKFNPNGARLWSTYYGGKESDDGKTIITDKAGNIYVAGYTLSSDSIATLNQIKYKNFGSTFLSKFSTNGMLMWGQYVNVVRMWHARNYHLAKDTFDQLYLAGTFYYDSSQPAPCSIYPYQLNHNTTTLGFVTCDTAGTIYNWLNFGGNDFSHSGQIAIYKSNTLYFTGWTQSTLGVATTGAHQTTIPNSTSTSCLYKFSLDTNVYLQLPLPDSLFCKGDVFDIKYVVTKPFNSGNTFAIQLSDATGSFASVTTIGTASSTVSGTITCTIPNNIVQSDKYKIRIIATNPFISACVQPVNIKIGTGIPTNISKSSNSPICRTDTLKLFASSSTTGATFRWSGLDTFVSTNPNSVIPNVDTYGTFKYVLESSMYGCSTYDTIDVTINQYPVKPTANANTPVCTNDTLKLNSNTTTTGISYSWTGPNSFTANTKDALIAIPPLSASGDYIVAVQKDGCTIRDTINVTVKPIAVNQTISSNSPVCAVNDTLKLSTSTTTGGVTYSWTGPNSFSSTTQNPTLLTPQTTSSGDYIASIILNGCIIKDTVQVTVKPKPSVNTSSNAPLCLGSTLNLNAQSATGTTFSWWGPAAFTSNQGSPVISNIITNQTGSYYVVGTLNGCVSDTATINVSLFSSTPKPTGSSNSPVCIGQTLNLSTPTLTGATYNWWGPGGFMTQTQNPSRSITGVNQSGDYYVTATRNGCISDTDTIAVVINWAPHINVVPLSNTEICQGDMVSFLAASNNAGTNPQYRWLLNGIPTGNTTTAYNSNNFSNGDIVSCVLTAEPGICGALYRDTSATYNIIVHPKLAPTVQITANPSQPLFENEMIYFTTSATNEGNTPIYQWMINNAPVQGATSNNWATNANTLSDGDVICVKMKSSYKCPVPEEVLSNCFTVRIKVGVPTIQLASTIRVYPNPVQDELIIDNIQSDTEIRLIDVTGRQLYHHSTSYKKHTINTSLLPPGNYILQLNDGQNNTTHKITKTGK